MTDSTESKYFSIRGLLATALSGFLSFKIYQVTEVLQEAENRYRDNAFFQSFIDLIRNSSTKGEDFVDNAYSKIKMLVYVFLISFGIRTILSFKHAFIDDTDNAKYVLYLFLVEAVLFGAFFGFEPFSDYFKTVIMFGIPSFIIYGLLDE